MGRKTTRSVWLPCGASQESSLPSTRIILCLRHLLTILPVHLDGNRRLFKTRVLAIANKRLKTPAKALEDKTIGALACLTSYEVGETII
jgi:hypothetical protein